MKRNVARNLLTGTERTAIFSALQRGNAAYGSALETDYC